MSRARNIKPGFFKNEELAELPFEFRILFQGLWCLADREGRLEDRPKRIKAEVFPYDPVDVAEGLNRLAEAGFIARYTADKEQYIQILAFKKHQNPHCKEAASTIPALCQSGASTEISGTSRADSLIPDSLIPDSKKKPARKRATPKCDFETFIADCKAAGELPIPADDPIYAYAESIGLPDDFLALAWGWFKAKRAGATQAGVAGWRAHFRDAVRGNWPKFWYPAADGSWALTTAGEQARRASA